MQPVRARGSTVNIKNERIVRVWAHVPLHACSGPLQSAARLDPSVGHAQSDEAAQCLVPTDPWSRVKKCRGPLEDQSPPKPTSPPLTVQVVWEGQSPTETEILVQYQVSMLAGLSPCTVLVIPGQHHLLLVGKGTATACSYSTSVTAGPASTQSLQRVPKSPSCHLATHQTNLLLGYRNCPIQPHLPARG